MFRSCFSSDLGSFHHHFFKYFSYLSLSFVISIMQVLLYGWCSISPSSSIYFLSLFFFPASQDIFNCLIFKLTDPFFCLLKSAVAPLPWVFLFRYCIFQLQNFYLVPFYNFYNIFYWHSNFFRLFSFPLVLSYDFLWLADYSKSSQFNVSDQ